jgi:hypothetical protein
MLNVPRLSFEVVKEGRILNFVSGYRRFMVRGGILILTTYKAVVLLDFLRNL